MLSRISNISMQRLTQPLSNFKYNYSFDNTHTINFRNTVLPNYSQIHTNQSYNWSTFLKTKSKKSQFSIWILGLLGTAIYFAIGNASAEEEKEVQEEAQQTKIKLVTKENFSVVIANLKENDPKVTSIEFNFILNDEQLKELKEAIKNNTELGYIAWYGGQPIYKDFIVKIECKLKKNNRNYRYYPTDYVHCLLSTHAYVNSKEKDPVILDASVSNHLDGWTVENVYNDTTNTGYYSAIYVNDKTHQIVLASRGTEELIKDPTFKKALIDLARKQGDWKTNLEEIVRAQVVAGQLAWHYQATEEAITLAKNKGYRLSFTGHSLGAWLAELGAFFCHAYFNNYCDVKAVTFDSPGSKQMMKKLVSNIESTDTVVKRTDIEIVTYLAAPNPINSCNQHVGKVYRVNRDMPLTEWIDNKIPDWIKGAVSGKLHGALSFEGHMLGGILATFDPVTGKPKVGQYSRMLDWPRLEFQGEKRNLESIVGKIANHSFLTKAAIKVADYLVGDTTAMSMVSLMTNVIEGKVYQREYWEYFEHIDLNQKDGKSVLRKDLSFDARFSLIAKAHYMEGDKNILKLKKGNVDDFLYELHKAYSDSEIVQGPKQLPETVRAQLKDLASSFIIEPIGNKRNNLELIVTTKSLDINIIRQRMIRLMHVIPNKVLNIAFPIVIGVGGSTIIISDNIPVKQKKSIFTGRNKELEEIDEQFKSKNIAIISGVGGVGKSTLAAKYVMDLKERGVVVRWIKTGNNKLKEQCLSFAHNLGINTEKRSSEEIRDEVYSKLLSMKKEIILVWDNVEKEEEINFGLKNLPENVKVLITTRNGKLLRGINHSIKLSRFTSEEAKAYLKKSLDFDDTNTKDLLDNISMLPLELKSMVQQFINNPAMTVNEYLKKIAAQDSLTKYPATQLLINELDKNAQEILRYCAYLDSDMIPLELLKQIIPDQEKLNNGINALINISLVDINNRHGYLSLHREVQEVVKEKNKEKETISKLSEEIVKLFPEGREYTRKSQEQAKRLNSNAIIIVALVKELKIDNSSLALLYSRLGYYYERLGESEKGLQYNKDALSIYQALYLNQNHYFIADTLHSLSVSYRRLGQLDKGLEYGKQALNIRRKLYPNQNHIDVARSLNSVGIFYGQLGNENEALKYQEEALKMRLALYPNQNHESIANSLSDVGAGYRHLGNIKEALEYQDKALKMRKALYPNKNHPYIADSWSELGICYEKSGNLIKAITYQEKALKLRREINQDQNHFCIAESLYRTAYSYKEFGDKNKALEYYKQAYGIWLKKNNPRKELAKKEIEFMQSNFFSEEKTARKKLKQPFIVGNEVGLGYRASIISHGEVDNNLLLLKQKIQSNVLNKLADATIDFGWSNTEGATGDWGVKSYIDQTYLKSQLDDLGEEQENIVIAQMLCFEAINLGVMKSDKKPYAVVESFCRTNPELVKKIAKEHPEFFVDGSIVIACIKTMQHDKEFERFLKQYVKYIGMEENKKKSIDREI